MSKTVVIATGSPFSEEARNEAVDYMEKQGLEVRLLEGHSGGEDFIEGLRGADAAIVRSDKVTKKVLETLGEEGPRLYVRGGAGFDKIDIDVAKDLGIVVQNTPGQNANSVAEATVGMMIALARNFIPADRTTKNGEWNKKQYFGTELAKKKLGLVGFGAIGKIVGRMTSYGLNMIVSFSDPKVTQEQANNYASTKVETLEKVFEGAHYVSLHLPENPQTEGMIGYDLLSRMAENGTLINAAKGGVIDYEGLERVLDERPAFKYGADVHFETDGKGDKRMAAYGDRVLLLPHLGAQTAEANARTIIEAANVCAKFLNEDIVLYDVHLQR